MTSSTPIVSSKSRPDHARSRALIAFAVLSLTSSACSVKQMAVDTQAEIMQTAFPVVEEQTDYEYARLAAPGNLMQIEGLLKVDPDNEQLLMLATQGYASYAYGFLEEEMEEAEHRGDLEAADEARARARAMYLKAKDFGMHLLTSMAPDLPESMQRDPDELAKALAEEFTDEEDAPALFWTGAAWASAINISRDDPALVADLPFPSTLVRQALKLDETYFNAGPDMYLGIFLSSRSETIGGDPAKGREHFERALKLTDRKALVIQYNYAKTYAVQTQNKTLFEKLLNEVLAQPVEEQSPVALANVIAKRRAKRLLSQVDTYFFEPLPPEPPAEEVPSAEPSAAQDDTAQDDTADAAGAPAVAPAGSPATTQPAATEPKPPTAAPKAPGGPNSNNSPKQPTRTKDTSQPSGSLFLPSRCGSRAVDGWLPAGTDIGRIEVQEESSCNVASS